MKRTTLYYLFFIAVFAQSCVIETSYHFNNDLSGHAETYIDLSGLMDFGGMNSDTSSSSMMDSIMQDKDEIISSIEKYGFTNIEVSQEKNVTSLSYDFENYKLLNQESKVDTSNGNNDFSSLLFMFYFEWKENNTLMITFRDDGKELTEEEKSQMGFLSSMVEFNINFSFDKEIKSIEAPFAVKKQPKSVELKPTLAELMDFSEKKQTLVINF